MYRLHSTNKFARKGLRKSEIIAKLDFGDGSDGTEDLSSPGPSSENLDVSGKDSSPSSPSTNQAADILSSDIESTSADSDSSDDIIQQSPGHQVHIYHWN